MPTSLSGSNAIGYHAFAYCNNLEVVYIPSYFNTYSNLINSSAFNYCYNLHEIYNYSSSYITPGQTSSIFGNLAYYALVVNTSENVARLQKATVNNVVYKYNNSNAWIVGYTGSYGTVRLGDSVKLGQKTFSSYDIAMHSFTSGIGTLYINPAVNEIYANAFSGVSSVVLHNGYTNINPDAFASYYVTCYFKGTQSEFYSKGYDSYLFYSVYYYTDCVHNSNEWTERSGIITTQRSYLYQVTENATCTEYGAYRYYCEYCNHTYSTGSINKLGHSISTGYYDCNRCDYFKTADITIYNYQSYAMQKLANIQLNGFENLSTYEFASNNPLTENTATITIVAKRDMIIDLDYALFATGKETITMSGGGKNITIDGEIDFSIGGSVDNSQGNEQFDLSAGQSLVITFSLNGETESTAYAVISNIVISMR